MSLAYFNRIDEFLGDRSGRYFGNGYLNTRQRLRDFKVSTSVGEAELTCIGSVDLPDVWSQKGEKRQKPHLSTIDVIELALECIRNYLKFRFNVLVLPSDYLREIKILAGNEPVEDSLTSIPISGKVGHDNLLGEVMELKISNMTVSIIYCYTPPLLNKVIAQSSKPVELDDVVWANRGEGLSFGVAKFDDRTSHYDEAWSVASCFACALQLGQLMLYKLDQVDRARSNTLWMKRTTIQFGAPLPTANEAQPIHARLVRTKRYTKHDGDWRRADIVANICSMTVICSVTHRLPERQSDA